MINLDSIFKSRDITLPTKVRLVKAMVFPVVMNGCESWTIKKAKRRRIDAFELWCWRRLLRVPWRSMLEYIFLTFPSAEIYLPSAMKGDHMTLGVAESGTTKQLHFHFSLSCIGEGNGTPLQYSCLENPRDRGA